MAQRTPPQTSELELSLFGPGIGESLLVHLGGGSWMVIDSCLNEKRDRPMALEYLELIGVDVATQVKLILVTHWHDDHIRGIAQLFQAAVTASFACSAALRCEEFYTLLLSGQQIKLVEETSGISEFADVLEIQAQRRPSLTAAGPDFWACDGICLFRQEEPYHIEVHSLSPSHQTITDSKAEIGRLIPKLGKVMRRFPVVSPNDSSVVLLVKTSGLHLLLGADLERGIDDMRGWRAVVKSALRPQVLTNAYKVAHHGSEGADLEDMWKSMVDGEAKAVLTPYARGSKPLPSNSDVTRIAERAGEVFCTAWPPTIKPPRRKNADLTINRVALNRRASRKRPGHIRLRAPGGAGTDAFGVELFDGAKRLA
jgi:beta-lactamase superfamily II metal-dependent hydrolase